jgi:hypothetical protein
MYLLPVLAAVILLAVAAFEDLVPSREVVTGSASFDGSVFSFCILLYWIVFRGFYLLYYTIYISASKSLAYLHSPRGA